ncbi:hypothetical protein PMIN03_011846 [Paraphaeosphaeria minitans]
MAEVIGIVASVIQVAGAGLKLSETLYQYAESVGTADRRIKDIATEIKLTATTIKELGSLFQQDATSKLLSDSALQTANETVRECSNVFEDISMLLRKSKKSTLGRVMLPFREPKIELFRSHVDKLKITLQLLTSVLMFAHQTAARQHDRAVLAAHREEIKELLQHKKKSTKRYEESVKNYSLSEDDTVVDDEENMKHTNQDPVSATSIVMTTAAIKSNITVETLNTCVKHVQSLLSNIETLQVALETHQHGADHSEHHQRLIGSYFRARQHLDSAFLGNSQDQPIPHAGTETDGVPLLLGHHHKVEVKYEKSKIDRVPMRRKSQPDREARYHKVEVVSELECAFEEPESACDEKTFNRDPYYSDHFPVRGYHSEKHKSAARAETVTTEASNRVTLQAAGVVEHQPNGYIRGGRKEVDDPVPVSTNIIEREGHVEGKVGTANAFRKIAKAAGTFNAGGFVPRAAGVAAKRLQPDEKSDERRPYGGTPANDLSSSDPQQSYRDTASAIRPLTPTPVSAELTSYITPSDGLHNIFDYVDLYASQVDDAFNDVDENPQTQSPNSGIILEREHRPYSRSPGRSDTREHERRENDKASESIPKARKRTKTGCLTCRKRRIKCGEERPTCTNCILSECQCEGYNQRVVFKPPIGDWPNATGRSEIECLPSPQLIEQDNNSFSPQDRAQSNDRHRVERGSLSPYISTPKSYNSPSASRPHEHPSPLATSFELPPRINRQPDARPYASASSPSDSNGELNCTKSTSNRLLSTADCFPSLDGCTSSDVMDDLGDSSPKEIAEKRRWEEIGGVVAKKYDYSGPITGSMEQIEAELEPRERVAMRPVSAALKRSEFRHHREVDESDDLDKEVDSLLRDWTTVL